MVGGEIKGKVVFHDMDNTPESPTSKSTEKVFLWDSDILSHSRILSG
jgi:hypothetical protein